MLIPMLTPSPSSFSDLHNKKPEPLHVQVMRLLVLYAEHEFNASTFTGRVCASTLSDIHSCVNGVIGAARSTVALTKQLWQ